ncbi:hypothetical protein [Mesorhizobium sp. M0323]|uniref:hypothetical protein n=1 Tax=Mesorhizobium sp. M0323 TaxID=2956938 RepID=UPI00333B6E6A
MPAFRRYLIRLTVTFASLSLGLGIAAAVKDFSAGTASMQAVVSSGSCPASLEPQPTIGFEQCPNSAACRGLDDSNGPGGHFHGSSKDICLDDSSLCLRNLAKANETIAAYNKFMSECGTRTRTEGTGSGGSKFASQLAQARQKDQGSSEKLSRNNSDFDVAFQRAKAASSKAAQDEIDAIDASHRAQEAEEKKAAERQQAQVRQQQSEQDANQSRLVEDIYPLCKQCLEGKLHCFGVGETKGPTDPTLITREWLIAGCCSVECSGGHM